MNEVEKFFEGLPSEDKQGQDVFDENQKPPENGAAPAKGNEGEGESEVRKNRRHRRLEDQLRKERESNIALAERIKVLAEVGVQPGGKSSEVPPEWIALYGDTPEARTAWAMQDRLIQEATERGKKAALAEFDLRQSEVVKQQKEFEAFIDNELEDLEEEFNVDLTSDAPAARKARREFLELVQKVSPKDDQGNITNYADFGSTFELMQSSKKEVKPNTDRKKEIAAQSMQESGRAPGAAKQITPGFNGWKKDLGLE